MIISTKGRYGLRAMFVLAINHGQGPMSINQIANIQGISEQYLEQLISKLKKAKLVKSSRGAQGGYELSYPPEKVSVGDVIRVLEGPLAPADCVVDADSSCEKVDYCFTHVIWKRIYDGINDVVDSISLQDMLDDYYQKIKNDKNATNLKC